MPPNEAAKPRIDLLRGVNDQGQLVCVRLGFNDVPNHFVRLATALNKAFGSEAGVQVMLDLTPGTDDAVILIFEPPPADPDAVINVLHGAAALVDCRTFPHTEHADTVRANEGNWTAFDPRLLRPTD